MPDLPQIGLDKPIYISYSIFLSKPTIHKIKNLLLYVSQIEIYRITLQYDYNNCYKELLL